MKIRITMLVLITALFALPAVAQDGSSLVSFNGFSFSFPSELATAVNITQYPGDAVGMEQPGGPEVAHTQFNLYAQAPAPESMFDAPAAIRVYRTADFEAYSNDATPDPFENFGQLQTLLSQRSDLAPYTTVDMEAQNNLPFMPIVAAAQPIRAQAQYLDAPGVSGIRYITVFRQDVAPFIGSEFMYVFQGISGDGAYYVSLVAKLNTDLFPAEIGADYDPEAFMSGLETYLNESVTSLNNAAPEAFTPSLSALDALVQTFSFSGMTSMPMPEATVAMPTAEATEAVSGDPAMLGLAGVTWQLVSMGATDAPVSVIADAPISLAFSEQGAGGNSGCNSYSGSFQYDNNALTFSPLVSTMMACREDIMTQEMMYLAALQTATSYAISGSQLQISYAGGVLTFVDAFAVPTVLPPTATP